MTIQNPPIFVQEGSHPAEDVRRALGSIVGQAGGLVSGSDLVVSENSAGADMSIDIASGAIWIAGTEDTYQGVYYCENRGVTNVPVQAADVVDPRIDLVVARVYDSSYSGTQDEWALDIVTGTPAASPVAPALPANSFSLATISVAANATTITDADITDTRVLTDETITGNLVVGGSIDASGGLKFQGTAGYAYVETVYFTSSNTFTKASYPWLRGMKVTVVGGGGGGGGASYSGSVGSASSGGGGGAGGVAQKWITDIAGLASSEAITVGSGGVASVGGSGGTSSAFSVSGNGGTAGDSGSATTGKQVQGGGAGGSASGGDRNVSGQNGFMGMTHSATATSGAGGTTWLGIGMGGQSKTTVPAIPRSGDAGRGYGGGGGGAVGAESVAATGGNGASGIVIVELYA